MCAAAWCTGANDSPTASPRLTADPTFVAWQGDGAAFFSRRVFSSARMFMPADLRHMPMQGDTVTPV